MDMNYRSSLASLLFLLICTVLPALLANSCKSPISEQTATPNVLIIFTDDLGYGDISTYDNMAPKTPNIDRIAEEGVLCTDFYVPTPYCAPSRATLLTGRFPLRHGLIRNPTPDKGINDIGISQDEITLGEVFQESGYRTKLIGKWHLGHKEEFFPVKHGFDEYYGILYSNDMRPVQIIENMDTVEYPVNQAYLTQKYTGQAVDFIKENQENPFFLHLCHAMPHKPLAASEEFYTPETVDDLYDDVIRELDWSTGEILSVLEELNILDNTIVIFLSDNGASYGGNNLPLKGRKHNNWEGGVRVPFMIRHPGNLPSGKVVENPCWSADIFPTLLSMCGIDLPVDLYLDGQDILEVLNGNEPEFDRKPDLTNWKDFRGPDGTTIIAPFEQATPAMYPGVKPEKMEGEVFLFNLDKDIAEMQNEAEANPEIVSALQEEYDQFMESLKE